MGFLALPKRQSFLTTTLMATEPSAVFLETSTHVLWHERVELRFLAWRGAHLIIIARVSGRSATRGGLLVKRAVQAARVTVRATAAQHSDKVVSQRAPCHRARGKLCFL